jgi:hypothetical protein
MIGSIQWLPPLLANHTYSVEIWVGTADQGVYDVFVCSGGCAGCEDLPVKIGSELSEGNRDLTMM